MRKQRHALELTIITLCIAVLAALMLGRSKPAAPKMSDEDVAAQNMSQAFKQKDFKKCLEISDVRLRQDPHDLVALRYRGQCLGKEGRPKEGLKVLSQAIEMARGPMDWFLYSNRLGRLHLERARLELQLADATAARTDLDKGIEVVRVSDFSPTEFYHLRALAKVALGDREGAQLDLDNASSSAPSNGQIQKHVQMLAGLAKRPTEGKVDPAEPCEEWCPLCHPQAKGEGGFIKN